MVKPSHKYKQGVQLTAAHAASVAANSTSFLSCTNGCGCLFNAATGRSYTPAGGEAPRLCSAVDIEVDTTVSGVVQVTVEEATALLRSVRMPTRTEMATEKLSQAARFGDPRMPATKVERDSVQGRLTEMREVLAMKLICLLSSTMDALNALTPAAQAQQATVPLVRAFGTAHVAEGLAAPTPLPMRVAMAECLNMAASILGLSECEEKIVADAPRWAHASTPCLRFTAGAEPKEVPFYWETLQTAAVNDLTAKLPAVMYRLPTSADSALSGIHRPGKVELHGPGASIISAAPFIGTLRAAKHAATAQALQAVMWNAWDSAFHAAADHTRKSLKHFIASPLGLPSRRQRAGSEASASSATSADSKGSSKSSRRRQAKKLKFTLANGQTVAPKSILRGGGGSGAGDRRGAESPAPGDRTQCKHCSKFHKGKCWKLQTGRSASLRRGEDTDTE